MNYPQYPFNANEDANKNINNNINEIDLCGNEHLDRFNI